MGPLILLLTTVIWGTAFLAQKAGADYLGPFAITVFRCLLGGAFLIGCVAVRFAACKAVRRSILCGLASGVPLFAAMVTQQIGIESTLPGVCAFLTTNYVLFVPLLGALAYRRLPHAHIWFGVALSLVGTYLICAFGSSLGLGRGEAWTILCALLYAVQMMVVDRFAPSCDILVMSASQLLSCAVLGAPFLLLPSEFGRISCASLAAGAGPLLYCGIVSSGIAYTLQNVGQARTPAALAAIILSLESVFGALSGWLFRNDMLTRVQLIGCGLVFLAAVGTQVLDILRLRKVGINI